MPAISKDRSTRCVACGGETVAAHLGGLRMQVRPLGSKRGTVAEPRVCPACGRVEFVCPNPAVFREALPDSPHTSDDEP